MTAPPGAEAVGAPSATGASPGLRGRRLAAFCAPLVAAMAGSVFTTSALGVLAPYLLPAFEMGRGELGAVIAVGTIGAGLVSPFAGRATDRFGARRSLIVVFGATAAAFALFAIARHYAVLVLGGCIAGVALAGSNPATNALIVRHLPAGERGTVTGVKQSGVHVGTFLGAAGLSVAAAALGWRWALAVVAALAGVAIVASPWVIPRDRPAASQPMGSAPTRSRLGEVLAVYAFLLGFANSATVFVPLYTVEELDAGPELGGLALSLLGLAAVAGRVVWARISDAGGRYSFGLRAAAVGGMVGYGIMWLAAHWGGWGVLAVGSVVAGATALSWNSIAMLAVMARAGADRAGAASGIVMLGFFLGLGAGPPLQGFIIDQVGGYGPVWALAVAFVALAWTLVRVVDVDRAEA
ncbi:MAG: MFS transporter [Acidimicrobiales bacterium]